jgi:hypothetical protein
VCDFSPAGRATNVHLEPPCDTLFMKTMLDVAGHEYYFVSGSEAIQANATVF